MVEVILMFTLIQLINVIISTIKSILTIKAGKITASIVNAVAYGFNVIVVKQIAGIDNVWILVFVTMITNFIGVYISKLFLEKTEKVQLWRISASVKKEQYDNFTKDLGEKEIQYFSLLTNHNSRMACEIFSYSREESAIIKSIFDKYDVKYTVLINKIKL